MSWVKTVSRHQENITVKQHGQVSGKRDEANLVATQNTTHADRQAHGPSKLKTVYSQNETRAH